MAKGCGIVSEKHPRSLNTNAAATIGMIHEHQFAAIRERFFQRGKLPRLGAEGFAFTFGVGGTREQGHAEVERGDPAGRFELCHRSISPGQYFGKMDGVGNRSSMLPWLMNSSRGTWTSGQLAGRDADDLRGANAFDDEVGLETNLDAAAAERNFSGRFDDVDGLSRCSHLRGAVVRLLMCFSVFSTLFIWAATPF